MPRQPAHRRAAIAQAIARSSRVRYETAQRQRAAQLHHDTNGRGGLTVELRPDQQSAAFTVRELEEQKRLAATHRPDQPSACRCCGQTVKPKRSARDLLGWKMCRACAADFLDADGDTTALAWGYVLGDTLTAQEVTEVRATAGSPFFFEYGTRADDPGNDHRFAHLDERSLLLARQAIESVCRRTRPSRCANGLGCAWCGVAISRGVWTTAHKGAVCSHCRKWYLASGQRPIDNARRHLLGAALGLYRHGRPVSAPLGSIDFALRSYAEVHPTGEGTDEPWSYLGGELARIRWLLVREFPKLATERERERMRQEDEDAERLAKIGRLRQSHRLSVLG